MPENDDQPDDAKPDGSAPAEAQTIAASSNPQPDAPDSNDQVTRRLLLYEVLIEEFETDRALDKDAPEPSPAPGGWAKWFRHALKHATQPRLAKRGDELKEELQQLAERSKQRTLAGPGARAAGASAGRKAKEKSDDDINAELVPQFFTMLTKAQQAEAERVLGEGNTNLRAEYRQKLEVALKSLREELGERSPKGEASDYVDFALAHEVYGIIDNHREKCRREKIAAAASDDEPARTREQAGEAQDAALEQAALQSWLKSLPDNAVADGESATNEVSPAPAEGGAHPAPDETARAAPDAVLRAEAGDAVAAEAMARPLQAEVPASAQAAEEAQAGDEEAQAREVINQMASAFQKVLDMARIISLTANTSATEPSAAKASVVAETPTTTESISAAVALDEAGAVTTDSDQEGEKA